MTVEQAVIDLSEEILIKELATLNFINEHFIEKPNSNMILYADNIGKDAFMAELEKGINDEIKNTPEKETVYSKSIKKAQERFLELKPKLEDIRISEKEIELRKCSCKANLKLSNDNSLELIYTVQINESDETFVELFIPEL